MSDRSSSRETASWMQLDFTVHSRSPILKLSIGQRLTATIATIDSLGRLPLHRQTIPKLPFAISKCPKTPSFTRTIRHVGRGTDAERHQNDGRFTNALRKLLTSAPSRLDVSLTLPESQSPTPSFLTKQRFFAPKKLHAVIVILSPDATPTKPHFALLRAQLPSRLSSSPG